MPRADSRGHAPPISLRDLVDEIGMERLDDILATLPDAVELKPKANECLRYVINGCIVLGYRSSATVTGMDSKQMHAVEALIRAAAREALEGSARVQTAVSLARTFVEYGIGVERDAITMETAVSTVLRMWGDLHEQERAEAYALLKRSLADPHAQIWYVQIVQALLAAYDLGTRMDEVQDGPDTADAPSSLPPSGTAIAVRSA